MCYSVPDKFEEYLMCCKTMNMSATIGVACSKIVGIITQTGFDLSDAIDMATILF